MILFAPAQAGIAGLKPYDPGHDLVALRRDCSVQPLVELGSNENNHGCSPKARQAMLEMLDRVHVYPDPAGAALKDALAAHHGVTRAGIVLGNGSHELLMQFAQVFAGPTAPVVASQHGFAVYALAAQAASAPLSLVPSLPEGAAQPRGHDLQAMARAAQSGARLVYLANPNNPTGTWYGAEAFEAFLAEVPSDVLVVVDEAYAEFVDAPDWASAIALLPHYHNLVVTRTFSKAHALAGLRIGYALAHPQCVQVLERIRESFNVNALALAAAEASLDDAAHLDMCVARNREQRQLLADGLAQRGLQVTPSQTNFLLVELETEAATLEADLLSQGVVLRPMGGYGLPRCLRITIGTAEENQRLLGALDRVMA